MMFVWCLVVEALSVLSQSVVIAAPVGSVDNGNISSKYLLRDGEYFEGDIILLPEQINYIQQSENVDDSEKSLISDPTALWPDKTVYYTFAPREFSLAQRQTIISALNDIMLASCVRFVQRTTQRTYIVLRNNGIGCASAVGYHGDGPLDLFLGGPTCQSRGTIQHEFLHTLGFWHEHTRLDRDNHVTIVWSNITPGRRFNFYKRDPSEIMSLNMPYDYGSVMHYRSIAFSKDLRSPTIIPKVTSALRVMGQRVRFSQVDIAKLNRLYKCSRTYYHGDDIMGKSVIVTTVDDLNLDHKEVSTEEANYINVNLTEIIDGNSTSASNLTETIDLSTNTPSNVTKTTDSKINTTHLPDSKIALTNNPVDSRT